MDSVLLYQTGGILYLFCQSSDGGSLTTSATTTISVTTGNTYYPQLVRDGTTLTLGVYTDAARTTLEDSAVSLTIGGTPVGIDNIIFGSRDNLVTPRTASWTVDDVKIYDGVTSI